MALFSKASLSPKTTISMSPSTKVSTTPSAPSTSTTTSTQTGTQRAMSIPSAPVSVPSSPSAVAQVSSSTSSSRKSSGGGSTPEPSATGVFVQYTNSPITDVKSGQQLTTGQGMINVAGGATRGGTSIPISASPWSSDAGFSALAAGIATGTSKQLQPQTTGALGDFKPATTETTRTTIPNTYTELGAGLPAGYGRLEQLQTAYAQQKEKGFIPGIILGATSTAILGTGLTLFNLIKSPRTVGLALYKQEKTALLEDPMTYIAKTGFALGVPYVLGKGLPFISTKYVSTVTKEPSFAAKISPVLEKPKPTTFKIEVTPETEIPLSLQRFRETQAGQATAPFMPKVFSGVRSMATPQQMSSVLSDLKLPSTGARTAEGLGSSMFTDMFAGGRQQLVFAEVAPKPPVTTVVSITEVAAQQTFPRISAFATLAIPKYKPQLSTTPIQLQSILQTTKAETSMKQVPLQIPSTKSLVSSNVISKTSTGLSMLPLLAILALTQQATTQVSAPPVIPPVLFSFPGIDLFGRQAKKSGFGGIFGRYTPNLRGIEGINLGSFATRGQTKFTGLEIRPIKFATTKRRRRK